MHACTGIPVVVDPAEACGNQEEEDGALGSEPKVAVAKGGPQARGERWTEMAISGTAHLYGTR